MASTDNVQQQYTQRAPTTRKRRENAVLIAAGNANPAQYQPPQRATTSDRSHSLPSPRATALYLHFAPLSRAPHTNTHSVSERTATYLRKLRSNQRIIPRSQFSGRSRGIQRTAANQATAVRGPACSCCVKCLSTTPRSCSPAQRRTVKIRTLSRVSSSTASNHCTCTDKPSCKRRRLVKQLSACVQRSAML